MSRAGTYVEINGQRYNAGQRGVNPPMAHHPIVPLRTQVMDGVVGYPKLNLEPRPAPVKPPVQKQVTRSEPKPGRYRKTQGPKTLMRRSVHKPAFGQSLFHAKASPLTATENRATDTTSGPAPEGRFKRAHGTPKSGAISRFASKSLTARTAVVPVAQPPKQTHAAETTHEPASHPAKNEVFSQELAAARSHEQSSPKQPTWRERGARKLHLRPRTLNIGTAILAALLLGAFFVYQNLPNLSMRLAAAKTGLHATLPAYHPAGFSLKSPIEYSPGVVTLNFKSNSDDRSFQVKQQSSDWNSDTLLESYVAKDNQPYQTYQDNGRIVYIDKSGANLVTGRKWIQIKSDGNLSTDQLLNIVKSID